MWLPRLSYKRHFGFHLALQACWLWGKLASILWVHPSSSGRNPNGKEMRPANSQHYMSWLSRTLQQRCYELEMPKASPRPVWLVASPHGHFPDWSQGCGWTSPVVLIMTSRYTFSKSWENCEKQDLSLTSPGGYRACLKATQWGHG